MIVVFKILIELARTVHSVCIYNPGNVKVY